MSADKSAQGALRRANVLIGPLLCPETPEPRPKTRAECREGIRPCPWVSCRYHLAVSSDGAGMRERHDVEHLATTTLPTCALDVAAEGPQTLVEIGKAMGTCRERARQVEARALAKARAAAEAMGFDLETLLPPPAPAGYDWSKAGESWERGELTPTSMKSYQAKRYQAIKAGAFKPARRAAP